MLAVTNRPNLDEQYLSATNSSDLTLNPDRTCAATHLIAAGLLGNRMGAALAHLRGDWDGLGKLRKATEAEIMARAAELPKAKGKIDVKRARGEMVVAHARAMRVRAHSLPGWRPALTIMAEWARLREVDFDLLSPALYHWLVPSCAVCEGRGAIQIPDTPALGKQCHACNGTGKTMRSSQAERVDRWLKGCAGKAKADRSGLLNGRLDSDDLAERTANRRQPAAEDERGAAAVAEVARLSMGKVRDNR